jgi:hypothetical protein
MKLNENLKIILLVVAVIASIAVQFYHPLTAPERARVFYDCRIAEISPDVPPLVKQECRKLQEKQ